MSRDLIRAAAERLAAAGIDNPRLDARVLWEHAQSLSSPACGGGGFERSEKPEGGATVQLFESFISRRAAREPLAYITGHREFWSLDFEVGPGVLVPRPETETIIEQALVLLRDRAAPLKVLDLGTGSGCILAALLKEFPNAVGLGIDSSQQALRIATANIARHGLSNRAEIRAGNWDENISGPWDVIVSNPPYIKSEDLFGLAPEVIDHEPRQALDGGPDGLDAIRALAAVIARRSPGVALIEIGAGQAVAAGAVMAGRGLVVVRTASDLAGIPRVLVTRPAGPVAKKELESAG